MTVTSVRVQVARSHLWWRRILDRWRPPIHQVVEHATVRVILTESARVLFESRLSGAKVVRETWPQESYVAVLEVSPPFTIAGDEVFNMQLDFDRPVLRSDRRCDVYLDGTLIRDARRNGGPQPAGFGVEM